MEKILAILVYIGEVGIYLTPIIYIVIKYFKTKSMEAKKILDMQNALYYLSNSVPKDSNITREEGEELEVSEANQDADGE